MPRELGVPLTDVQDATAQLGETIRRLRRERGLSQRDLTRLAGFSAHSNLADYEAGRRIPPIDVVRALERALGVDGHELSQLHRDATVARARAEQANGRLPLSVRSAPPIAANATNSSADGLATNRPHSRSRRRRTVWLLIAASIVVAGVASILVLRGFGGSAKPQSLAPVGDGRGALSMCDRDGVTLDTQEVLTTRDAELAGVTLPAGSRIGTVSLRYSAECGLAWTEFVPTHKVWSGIGQEIVGARRVNDGATTSLTLNRVAPVDSDPLLTLPGCVYGTVAIDADGSAIASEHTRCFGS